MKNILFLVVVSLTICAKSQTVYFIDDNIDLSVNISQKTANGLNSNDTLFIVTTVINKSTETIYISRENSNYSKWFSDSLLVISFGWDTEKIGFSDISLIEIPKNDTFVFNSFLKTRSDSFKIKINANYILDSKIKAAKKKKEPIFNFHLYQLYMEWREFYFLP
ncbi:MAG TPA: hypothetical protein VEC12_01450 [Bacteroidia bacterium]|nr:hypothetical protein [Bacteroidia bacterium]